MSASGSQQGLAVVLVLVLVLGLVPAACGRPEAAPPVINPIVETPATPVAASASSETAATAPAPAMTAPDPNALFDITTAAGWERYQDAGATVAVSAAPGTGLVLDYAFGSGKWLGAWRSIGRDLSTAKGIRFIYRGEGVPNTLEFKLEDKDGSSFGQMIVTGSNPAGWITVDVPFSNLQYWWGGDRALDLKDCKIHFAVSVKSASDQGGNGKLVISSVALLP